MKLIMSLIVVVTVAIPATAQQDLNLDQPRPIPALDSVWIEELTWMEVRDAIKAGKNVAIIAAGSLEQNGPYVPTAKHGYVLQATAEAIARKLKNALVAPLVLMEPGQPENPRYPGTIPVRMETYKAILTDIATSLKQHGFKDIVMIGDSGGNQRGLKEVTAELKKKWTHKGTRIHYVREYYDSWRLSDDAVEKITGQKEISEGIHDDYSVNSIIMTIDPEKVRYKQRIAVNKASINGISIEPKEQTIANGKKLVEIRANAAVKAIRQATARPKSNQ